MFDRIRSVFRKADARALFATEVEELARAVPSVANVARIDEAYALDITSTSGVTHRMFLENFFAESREMSPEQRRSWLVATLSSRCEDFSDIPWEKAREMLAPVVRGAAFGSIAPSDLPAAVEPGKLLESHFIRRTFAPFLDVFVVLDLPTNMLYVNRAMVERWEIDEHEVFETALARFASVANPEAQLYDETHGPLFAVATGDAYEASRLLIPGWLASFRGRVEGEPIAIAPQRELLFVGGSRRPEMIQRLLDMAEREFASSPRRISPALYTVAEDGRVIPFSANHAGVRVAQEKLATFEYDQQKNVLAKEGDSVFVASYTVYQADDGSVRSISTWTKTIPTLLPKTTLVALVTPNAEGTKVESTVVLPWDAIDDFVDVAPDMHPPRYRTRAFPDPATLERLRGEVAGTL